MNNYNNLPMFYNKDNSQMQNTMNDFIINNNMNNNMNNNINNNNINNSNINFNFNNNNK